MPKSKRERKSALTRVQKKNRANKDALVTKIRAALEEVHPLHLYVFSLRNQKNSVLKELREQWAGSRFFMGKNKVMQLALGRTPEEEERPGLAALARQLSGTRGLLATSKGPEEVAAFFADFTETHYARSGFRCKEHYKLAAGTLPADRCPHPMEPMLRRLGLPTKLVQGKVELLNEVHVARAGDVLTPEQCKILQIFGVKLAQFQVKLVAHWHDGAVSEMDGAEDSDDDEEEQAAGEDAEDEGIELRTAGGEFEPYMGGFADDDDEGMGGEDEEEMFS